MSQIKKLINQKFLEGIDSTKFHVAQNGAIMAKDSSGSMIEFLKVNSDNKGVVLGKVISTKDEVDELIADLAQEILDRQAGDVDAKAYADQKIADLVNGAPALLDTLKELADAIGNDENFAVTIASQIGQLQSDLATEIARAEAAEAALSGRVTTVENDLNALEGVVQGNFDLQQSDIDGLRSDVDAAAGRLDALEPKVSTLEEEMDEAQGNIVALEGRMSTAEGDIDAVEGRLDAVEPKVSALETEMDEAQADIVSLEGRMSTAESDINAVEASVSAVQSELDAVDGRLVDLEDDHYLLAGEVADLSDDLLLEVERAEAAESALDARLDAVEPKVSTLEMEMDQAQSDINAVEAGLAQEVLDRQAGDSSLQTAINTEKARVDAILDASQADKDSFVEIVALINSVDTENDSAFAGYVLSNNAALAQEVSDREDGDNALQGEVDAVEVRATSLEGRMTTAESDIDSLEGRMTSAESSISSMSSDKADKSYVDSQDAALQGEIDALEGRMDTAESDIDALQALAFHKESKTISSSDLTSVELEYAAKENSIMAHVGRLALHEGQDFSVALDPTSGKSRLTWMNDFMSGASEGVEEGMKLFFQYFYSGSAGSGGGGGGGGPSSSTLELYHFDGAGVGVNGNDFTQFGTLTYNPGKFSSGVSNFSANLAYLKRDAGFLSPIGSGDFTIEFWAKLNDGSSQTAFAVINDPSPGIIPTEKPVAFMYNGNGQWFDYLIDGNLALSINASGKKDNNWHHIVLQRNSGVLRGFIDGAFVSSANYVASMPSSGYELSVGRSGSSNPSYWEGEIDELRISNAAIYDIAGFTPPVAPLT